MKKNVCSFNKVILTFKVFKFKEISFIAIEIKKEREIDKIQGKKRPEVEKNKVAVCQEKRKSEAYSAFN